MVESENALCLYSVHVLTTAWWCAAMNNRDVDSCIDGVLDATFPYIEIDALEYLLAPQEGMALVNIICKSMEGFTEREVMEATLTREALLRKGEQLNRCSNQL